MNRDLITELQVLGIKHNADEIIKIGKNSAGKIIFLESGDLNSGLQHILHNHQDQFSDLGIAEDRVADAVILAVLEGKTVGYQTANRPVYRLTFNSQICYIAVTVGNNGYIVCANPRSGKDFGGS